MEEEIHVPDDQELWASLPTLEGEAKADALSLLSISYSGSDKSQYAIALAEEAKDLYMAAGFDGSEIEFIWIWGVLAESNAALERFNDAIEAGLKCLELYERYFVPGYERIRWDLIRWYLEAYRFDEAKAQFEEMYGRYKFTSELVFSECEDIELE